MLLDVTALRELQCKVNLIELCRFHCGLSPPPSLVRLVIVDVRQTFCWSVVSSISPRQRKNRNKSQAVPASCAAHAGSSLPAFNRGVLQRSTKKRRCVEQPTAIRELMDCIYPFGWRSFHLLEKAMGTSAEERSGMLPLFHSCLSPSGHKWKYAALHVSIFFCLPLVRHKNGWTMYIASYFSFPFVSYTVSFICILHFTTADWPHCLFSLWTFNGFVFLYICWFYMSIVALIGYYCHFTILLTCRYNIYYIVCCLGNAVCTGFSGSVLFCCGWGCLFQNLKDICTLSSY